MQWGSIMGLALICSAYGFVLQAVIQKYVTTESTGFMFSLEPIFSAIFAFTFLQERLETNGYVGAVLIFLGVFIANSKLAYRKNNASKIKAGQYIIRISEKYFS